MRIFPTVTCQEHFYLLENHLITDYVPGSVCLLAPGDSAWESDLILLEKVRRGEAGFEALATVAAKYLINRVGEPD